MTKADRIRWLIASAVVLLVAGVATATAYVTRENIKAETVQTQQRPVAKKSSTPAPQKMAAAQSAQQCDDGNILGYAAGGIAGGVVGHQIGSGSGKTAATIGGTLGGAYLGGQYIPLRGATCKQ